MSKLDRFLAYAVAFEEAFASDDWSKVEPFFTEDAEYFVPLDPPLGGWFRGRDAILAYFKDSLDRLDRRFESRQVGPALEGPYERAESVRVLGRLVYRAADVPDFVLEVEEEAYFEGDRIHRMIDSYSPAMREQFVRYQSAHGGVLGIESWTGPRAEASTKEPPGSPVHRTPQDS